MKATELRQKSEHELLEMITKLKTEVREVSLDVLKNKEKNVKKPRLLRKEIARIKSILVEKKVLDEDK